MKSMMTTDKMQSGTKPLFCLLLPKNERPDIPDSVDGRIEKEHGDFFFLPCPETGLEMVRMKLWKKWDPELLQRFSPLFSFMAEEDMLVTIHGTYLKREGVYGIRSFSNISTDGPLVVRSRFSADFLEMVTRMLLQAEAGETGRTGTRKSTGLQQTEEIEAYYKVCRHALPA